MSWHSLKKFQIRKDSPLTMKFKYTNNLDEQYWTINLRRRKQKSLKSLSYQHSITTQSRFLENNLDICKVCCNTYPQFITHPIKILHIKKQNQNQKSCYQTNQLMNKVFWISLLIYCMISIIIILLPQLYISDTISISLSLLVFYDKGKFA